jgi:hypothetical protein
MLWRHATIDTRATWRERGKEAVRSEPLRTPPWRMLATNCPAARRPAPVTSACDRVPVDPVLDGGAQWLHVTTMGSRGAVRQRGRRPTLQGHPVSPRSLKHVRNCGRRSGRGQGTSPA